MTKTSKISTTWLLIAAIVVSLGFQLATIGKWSIWQDEGYTSMLITYPAKDVIERTAHDVHPPLYYLLLKAWHGVVGQSAVGLRLFSVIFMLLAIYMAFLLVRKLCGELAARWSLLPLALAPALIRYGQEMRMYAWVAFLGTAATLMLVTLLTDKGKLRHGQKMWLQAGYAVAAIAMLYSHYFSVLLLVVHGLMILGKAVDDKELTSIKELPKKVLSPAWRVWLATYALVALAFLPWVPKFLAQSGKVTSGFWIGRPNIGSFFSSLSSFVLFRPVWQHWQLEGWYAALIILTAAVTFVIFRAVWRTYQGWMTRTALLGYFLIPTLILFIISMPPLTPVYYDRYLVMFAPMFFASLGVGLAALHKSLQPRRFAPLLGVLLILLGYGLFNTSYYGNNYGLASEDYFAMKPAMAQLKMYYQPGDAIIIPDITQYLNAQFYTKSFASDPLMPAANPVYPYGNYSVISNRLDLVTDTLEHTPTTTNTVWIVTQWRATDDFVRNNVPPTWVKLPIQFTYGETQVTAYHKG